MGKTAERVEEELRRKKGDKTNKNKTTRKKIREEERKYEWKKEIVTKRNGGHPPRIEEIEKNKKIRAETRK